MYEKEITCDKCDNEFILSYDIGEPEFCPFCGSKISYEDEDLEDFLDLEDE